MGIAMAFAATMSAPRLSAASPQVLLRDDFDGASLDKNQWSVGNWKLGRTQLEKAPVVSNGFARLTFETFDPHHAGRNFLGTEIDSNQSFSLGKGLEFEARVRVNAMPPGLVTSFFTYSERDIGGSNFSDEIDFEWLSALTKKSPATSPPIQLTSFRAFNHAKANLKDQTQTTSENVRVAALNLSGFNTFMIRWLPDRVEWLVNGRIVKTAVSIVPEQPMNLCLNFWAPDKKWGEAYSSSLSAAKSARSNRVFTYDVDYVEVRQLSDSVNSS